MTNFNNRHKIFDLYIPKQNVNMHIKVMLESFIWKGPLIIVVL